MDLVPRAFVLVFVGEKSRPPPILGGGGSTLGTDNRDQAAAKWSGAGASLSMA